MFDGIKCRDETDRQHGLRYPRALRYVVHEPPHVAHENHGTQERLGDQGYVAERKSERRCRMLGSAESRFV